jgi:hypothetical protein
MCYLYLYLQHFGVPIHRSAGLIFIHIPKTAGTSIEASINLHGDWRIEDQDRLFGKIRSRRILRKNLSSNFLQHLTFREISLLLGGQINDFKIFSVVRHPLTRFLSSFKRKDPDLCEFVKWRSSQNIESFSLNEYSKLLRWVRHPHLNTQSSFLSSCSRNIPDPRIKIFKFEELHLLENWLSDHLQRSVSFPRQQLPLCQLPELSDKKISRLKTRIRSRYREDYVNFGY